MNTSSTYYVKVNDNWLLESDSESGYRRTEEFTHCQECHIFLSGHKGPRLALCSECFADVENRSKQYRVRGIFGQS